jgi:hypothetical protein
MRKILIFFLILSMLIIPGYSEMRFRFEGHGEESVMTTYTNLVESRIEETGMSRGLKAGSFNYLDASDTGGTIDVKENMNYFYGNRTINNSGSWVSHTLALDFKGKRGISEYYARGFYNNNRYLSAWKKIRYEDTRSLKRPDYPTYNSSAIHVKATSLMDTEVGSYNMAYHASVMDGVIQTHDAAGWTNLTGARKVEWEHETLSRGKLLKVTNELSEYNLTTAAGGYDWLPCFYSGTIPTIEGEDWPTQRMVKVLQADTLLPAFKMQRDYYFSSPFCIIEKCSNTSTISQSCPNDDNYPEDE